MYGPRQPEQISLKLTSLNSEILLYLVIPADGQGSYDRAHGYAIQSNHKFRYTSSETRGDLSLSSE